MATKKSAAKAATKKTRVVISGDVLPRRSLEQVIRVAEILHTTYAGKSASWNEVSQALGIGANSPNTKYIIWGAQSYGIVNKEENNSISLAETGRKIVAPNYDGEDGEGRIKAILTPTMLSKFYSDYNGHQVPSPIHFPNVLESRYEVPRDRVAEVIEIIMANGSYAGIFEATSDGEPTVRLAGTGLSVSKERVTEVVAGRRNRYSKARGYDAETPS